jgi:predicted enzyme related to lactoylglutathione lyase
MTVRAIHHVNLTCPAAMMGALIAFYRDIVGLTPAPRPATQRPTGAWFAVGEQQELHLSADEQDPAMQATATRHVCFDVADLDAIERRLLHAGRAIEPDRRPVPGNRLEFASRTGP